MTVKEHLDFQDITTQETNEIKDLYVNALYHLQDLKDEDSILSVCNHVNGYELMDSYNDDVFTVSIATDNTAPNTLQGIRVYVDKETHKLSRFIDVYFNDEEYPFEDYEVMTEE